MGIRVAASAVGLAGVGILLAQSGAAEVAEGAERALPWLPVLMAVEAARIGAELLAGRSLLGADATRVRWGSLIRLHLIAYCVSVVTPAGRAAAEATKAVLLARRVAAPVAWALAGTNQMLSLCAEAALSLLALAAALLFTKTTLLCWALLGHALLCCALAIALRRVLISERAQAWLRRVRSLECAVPAFRSAVREQRLLRPALWFFAGKSLQLVLLTLLFHAVGAGLALERVFLVQGLNVVASVLGDLVPAQLGTTDGVFAWGAASIGVSTSAALSVSLLLHGVQLVWVAVGALTPLLWPDEESLPGRVHVVTGAARVEAQVGIVAVRAGAAVQE
ncbi:MAG TPA: lysylphosphatidylglycerol synthase domain-containing protein [Polyangiaceae bacterium]|nr:lysylphosphatidylglycerol synthase domain-containing protein [Polyangiaceae bacterium]